MTRSSAVAPAPASLAAIRRPPAGTLPARSAAVAGRLALLAGLTVAVAAIHLRHRPATLCLLRAVTGVPCPFCGGTTAAVDIGRGQVGAAVRASPLAVALLAAWPFVGTIRAPGWWREPVVRRVVVGVVLIGAELWQMHRFGLLGA